MLSLWRGISQEGRSEAFDSGLHTAVLRVKTEVCLQCGERLYSEETVRRFEDIRQKLKNQQTEEFIPLGRSFQVG